MTISALGVGHYELVIENDTNNEITVETNHKLKELNLDMKSDIKIKPKHKNSHIVTIANNCKDTLVRVKNQYEECLAVGFTLPFEIHATEESSELPVTKLTIVELNDDNLNKQRKTRKQKRNNNHCKFKIEEINK